MGNSISAALDTDHVPGSIIVPAGYTTPPFPSLYIPSFINTQRQRGIFLYEAEAIWRFTLYWNLMLLGLIFVACSLLASFSLLLSSIIFRDDSPSYPARSSPNDTAKSPKDKSNTTQPTVDTPSSAADSAEEKPTHAEYDYRLRQSLRKTRKRPPLWPIFILPLATAALAALVAVITGTVVGFALAAVYSAAGFSMSTWVPFLWALIIVLVLIISSYSTLTSIL